MEIKLEYTGREALEIAKNVYGENFNKEIERCQNDIKLIGRIYKKDHKEAYKKLIASGCSSGSTVFYFAALFLLMKETEVSNNSISIEVKKLKETQDKYINNLEALEKSKEDEKTKRELRSYFAAKRDELSKEIQQLCNSFTVNDAQVLVIQTNLFG